MPLVRSDGLGVAVGEGPSGPPCRDVRIVQGVAPIARLGRALGLHAAAPARTY